MTRPLGITLSFHRCSRPAAAVLSLVLLSAAQAFGQSGADVKVVRGIARAMMKNVKGPASESEISAARIFVITTDRAAGQEVINKQFANRKDVSLVDTEEQAREQLTAQFNKIPTGQGLVAGTFEITFGPFRPRTNADRIQEAANKRDDAEKNVLVKDVRIHFHTMDDDREGGIVQVDIRSPNGREFLHIFPEYPAWKPYRKHEVIVELNKAIPLEGLVARITLTEANEVNIAWTFEALIELRDPAGKTVARFFKYRYLDTTGPGYPRSDFVTIKGTTNLSKWKVTATGLATNRQRFSAAGEFYDKEYGRGNLRMRLYFLAALQKLTMRENTIEYTYEEIK
jgi:hypothetical protein